VTKPPVKSIPDCVFNCKNCGATFRVKSLLDDAVAIFIARAVLKSVFEILTLCFSVQRRSSAALIF